MQTLATLDDVWVLDNPDTLCREVYRQGHLVVYFPAEAFAYRSNWYPQGSNRYIQEMYLVDMGRLGEFFDGAEYGSPTHKPIDPLATSLWEE